jgi:hypothetical protein
MSGFVKSSLVSLLVSGAIQLCATGCSSQLPAAPEADRIDQVAAIDNIGAGISTGIDGVNLSNHGSSTEGGNLAATDLTTRQVAVDEQAPQASTQIEFTALIAGLDSPNNIIRLMEMQGSFKTWIGHVDANSELFGLNNEPVTLADFGVCSQAIVRGVQISDNEITINYLKMKNF